MGDNLRRFPAIIGPGVNTRAPSISPVLTLTEETSNVSAGIRDGIGPRFGMAPLPNHSDTDTTAISVAPYLPGLAANESSAGAAVFGNRRKLFGATPVVLPDPTTTPPTMTRAYVWLVSKYKDADEDYVELTYSSKYDASSPQWTPRAELAAGIGPPTIDASPDLQDLMFFTAPVLADWDDYVIGKFSIPNTTTYAGMAVVTVAGKDESGSWLWGRKITNGSATVPCTSSFLPTAGSTSATLASGVPSNWNTRRFKNSSRQVTIFDLDATNGLQYGFVYSVMTTDSANIYSAGLYPGSGGGQLIPASLPAATTIETRLDGAASSASSVDYQLINDPDNVINSGYGMILAAAGIGPVAFLTKSWLCNASDHVYWAVDLTTTPYFPSVRATANSVDGTPYTEDGTIKGTCFAYWPDFVTGTALPTETAAARTGSLHFTLGQAGSGILRANTEYEFTYSIYNKLISHETNVGEPARFYTDSDDFVALSIYRDPTDTGASGGVLRQRVPTDTTRFPFTGLLNSRAMNMLNYLEFRFYYRERGSYEWLPALFIDAAKLFYFPNFNVLWSCESAIAGLPGGQPGGFNDYGNLPAEDYIDVVVFQERAFWLSETAIRWSYRRNMFAYAGRNSSACPAGQFLGMKVHVYAGERENSNRSRLVVAASDAIYVGYFTGAPFEQPVQVSPDDVASFPLEGSDFNIDFWTSFTAYSGRAMVVGDGVLYYWGPNGAFMDAGGGYPERISQELEPEIFKYVDPTRTDEVVAHFSEETQEVYWFYPPAGEEDVTHLLVYNARTKRWLPGSMNGRIDAAFRMSVEGEAVNWGELAGKRSFVVARVDDDAVIQRPYYFDVRNVRTGDYWPTKELLTNSIQRISGGLRINLFTGWSASVLGEIAVGDYIGAPLATAYTAPGFGVFTVDIGGEFLSRVIAVNTVSGYIDVEDIDGIPSNSVFNRPCLLPLWHMAADGGGLHGIEWTIESNHWIPSGVDFDGFWLFFHTVSKLDLLDEDRRGAAELTYALAVKTPTNTTYSSDAYVFRDNFDGHDQSYFPLSMPELAVQGQGFKFKLSGVQLCNEWVLQYIAAHASPSGNIDFLKAFEPEKA